MLLRGGICHFSVLWYSHEWCQPSILQPFHRDNVKPLITCSFFYTPVAETRKAENRCMRIISAVNYIQSLVYSVYFFFGIFHIDRVWKNQIKIIFVSFYHVINRNGATVAYFYSDGFFYFFYVAPSILKKILFVLHLAYTFWCEENMDHPGNMNKVILSAKHLVW